MNQFYLASRQENFGSMSYTSLVGLETYLIGNSKAISLLIKCLLPLAMLRIRYIDDQIYFVLSKKLKDERI